MKRLLLALAIALIPSSAHAAWSEYNRLYYPANGDHFYTPSQTDVTAAKTVGYQFEGFIGYVQTTLEAGTQPLYKAFNPNSGEHFYTVSQTEYNNLTGWTKEGISAYVGNSQTADTTPYYRLYLTSGKHFYTTSLAEKNALVAQGHTYENISGYLYKTAPVMVPTTPVAYSDGRPSPSYRQPATDRGVVLAHGGTNDSQGARDAFVYEEAGTYYLTYDGAANNKWKINMATSTDLTTWTKNGVVLEENTSCGCYGTIHKFGSDYLMYYIGSPTQQADGTPQTPYKTKKAHASSLTGTWTKDGDTFPLQSYYVNTGSPGQIVQSGSEYLMFFSSANSTFKRTIGIARSNDPAGTWTPDTTPILPVTEQIENASLYEQNGTWFMFVNHVGIAGGIEYTDAVYVYWTTNLNSWNPASKAVVLDQSVTGQATIGLPSVVKVGDKLMILYDGKAGQGHLDRDIRLAEIKLPLVTP